MESDALSNFRWDPAPNSSSLGHVGGRSNSDPVAVTNSVADADAFSDADSQFNSGPNGDSHINGDTVVYSNLNIRSNKTNPVHDAFSGSDCYSHRSLRRDTNNCLRIYAQPYVNSDGDSHLDAPPHGDNDRGKRVLCPCVSWRRRVWG